MQDKKFSPTRQTAFDARFEAQKIAFGPVVFQCVRIAWKSGLLQQIAHAGSAGVTVEELNSVGRWTTYQLKLLLESCLSAGVVCLCDGRYVLDKIGYCFIGDSITQINMNFVNDVCYQGLFELERSLDEGKPLGLKALGNWPTLYEGMAELPEPAKGSWFAFDHFYSDTSFPDVLPDVFSKAPQRVMDIGANTGKFSIAALLFDPRAELHLVDLPQQLAVAKANLAQAGLTARATLHPVDMLDPDQHFACGMDVIWMSQFLSCFSEEVISSIISRSVQALAPQGEILIMDTFWDLQRYDIASYCLINTSPYFTAIASGNSKVYESSDYVRLCEQAGLKLLNIRQGIGYCHSLLRFAKVSP